ncbi:hypothetical protein DDF67_00550 [Caulobacter endophyticus]|uniref:Uncharacterized protein n=1 Tax=Caulobacter endophyticus TaxID=2172652 RepID=A0A2T9KDQ5_9CAUL|nr:hypothetical protein DDF67_00550 [Caulobacter endophyticus]
MDSGRLFERRLPLARHQAAHHFAASPRERTGHLRRSPKREADFGGAPVLKRRSRAAASSKAAAFPYLIHEGG